MFYGQCWKCLERWELGTASTCKCPEETTIDWTEAKLSSPVFTLSDAKPNHNITFHNQDGKQVGELNFNGPEMVFNGDMNESAKVFFDFIATAFKARLEQERADEREKCEVAAAQAAREAIVFAMDAEREACAKVCDDLHPGLATKRAAEIIRARGDT